jgi:hypothetical protein
MPPPPFSFSFFSLFSLISWDLDFHFIPLYTSSFLYTKLEWMFWALNDFHVFPHKGPGVEAVFHSSLGLAHLCSVMAVLRNSPLSLTLFTHAGTLRLAALIVDL